MDQTARFALPYLAPAQLQKEFFYNEALQRVDTLLCPAVEGPAVSVPPASPAVGDCYLVASGATGAWAGQDETLACFSEGGWRFVPPIEGMSLADRSSGERIEYRNGGWQSGIVDAQEVRVDGQAVLRNRQPAIGNVSGGTVVDSECRTTVSEILGALRAHGLIG